MIDNFKKEYISKLNTGLDAITNKQLQAAIDMFVKCMKNNKNIFVCGNGGSASISEHMTCDHSKGIASNTRLFPRLHCLSSNMSLVTAIANDIGYSDIFSHQLAYQGNDDDLLVVISSSGNSPNVVNALKAAKILKMKTISFTGFDGGKASKLADNNLHVPINN